MATTCRGWECAVRWLSVNGEAWGVGPTGVFASAAALSLYHELKAALLQDRDSMLQRTLLSTMVLGMLALMVHLWVCAMRFFQYYLDTIIKDSPSVLLEVTKVGLLGERAELVPLGSLTRFLRQQQPQVHVTLCWFIALCYADYVRKHCCQRFNMPYLDEWQSALQSQAARGLQRAVRQVNSFVGSVHARLRLYDPPTTAATTDGRTLADEAARTCCKSCETATLQPSIATAVDEAARIVSEATMALERSALDVAAKAIERSGTTEAAKALEREALSKTNLIIESLRTYIAETRCSCAGGEQARARDVPPRTGI